MALIKCSECGQQVSTLAAACPGCGAPPPKGEPASQVRTIEVEAPATKSVLIRAAAVVAVLGLIYWFFGPESAYVRSVGVANPQPGVSESAALTSCQYAIRSVSKDPETASVPYVPNTGGGDYVFKWTTSTKLARMRNGFGLEIGVPAECIVDRNNGKIIYLEVEGQKLV